MQWEDQRQNSPVHDVSQHWGSLILSLSLVTYSFHFLLFIFPCPFLRTLSSLFPLINRVPAPLLKVISLCLYFLSFALWYSSLRSCYQHCPDGWLWECATLTVAECPGEEAATKGQTLKWSQGAALVSVQGQKFTASALKLQSGNWLVQANPGKQNENPNNQPQQNQAKPTQQNPKQTTLPQKNYKGIYFVNLR